MAKDPGDHDHADNQGQRRVLWRDAARHRRGWAQSAVKSISTVLNRAMLIVSFITPEVDRSPIFVTSKV
jgi:hypothetical protein